MVNIIGAGLGGCEAALVLSKFGYHVRLYECKPAVFSPAHKSANFCELVCSNSLKSNDIATAGGLIKEELRILDSPLIAAADECKVKAGGALAVNREQFAQNITNCINNDNNIEVIEQLVETVDVAFPTIIATGPLTIGRLNDKIKELFGQELHFYDAAAPIISAASINYDKTFSASRYGKGEDDYINCPLSKEEYECFTTELINAECVILREFEKSEIFEGCMPIEVMAKRGFESLRFGPLRPVGFVDPNTNKRPYAVIQLRRENAAGDMFNIVGFQTNLKFGEQKRVFSLIPALENAEFLRYGVMHRNSYINAPKSINRYFQNLQFSNVFIAGQLSGVEGYVESIASGHIAALNIARLLEGKQLLDFPQTTIIGALSRYIEAENPNFQPMNANFGILPPLQAIVKDKQLKKRQLAQRSIDSLKEFKQLECF